MPKLKSQIQDCSNIVLKSSNVFQEEVVVVNSKDAGVNQKQTISPAKYWRFTLNNYSQSEICSIVPMIEEFCE